MSSAVIARPGPLVLGDLIAANRSTAARAVRDVLLVAGAAGFVGALAQISIHLSFTPVPITGQTLGVLLAGTALGWRRAAAALALYAVAGVAGVPWFEAGTSGYASASFGYVIGFFFAATVCGWLAGRGADRTVLKSVPAMIAGEVLIYGFGMAWLAVDLHLSASATIAQGLTPFLGGDAIKAAIAAGLLPLVWWKLPAGGGRPPARHAASAVTRYQPPAS
jgi:biotin transport system substrate-specific component